MELQGEGTHLRVPHAQIPAQAPTIAAQSAIAAPKAIQTYPVKHKTKADKPGE